jgi:hypothetical protein
MVGGFDDKVHVAYISETILLELGYIERDPHNKNVRLTPLGLQNCGKGIRIPPSDIQKLKKLLGME